MGKHFQRRHCTQDGFRNLLKRAVGQKKKKMAERSHFAPPCKWTVFMGCLRHNVFDTVFSKVLPLGPPLHGKRPKPFKDPAFTPNPLTCPLRHFLP